MLSKEEIEKAKEDFNFCNEGDYITKEMSDSKNVLLNYIDKLESREQKLIEKLEEDKKKYIEFIKSKEESEPQELEQFLGKIFDIDEILSIVKGEKK